MVLASAAAAPAEQGGRFDSMEAGVADVTLGRIPLYRQSNVNAGGAYDSRWTAPEMRRNCFLVIGNHERYGGIGDVLFTLATYFSRHFNVLVSESLVPNEINVLIDEFSQRTFVDNVRRTRVEYPNTRFILMATEFVTEMSIFGCSFGNTFNYFDIRDNFRQWLELIAYKFGIKPHAPYLLSRYRGFVDVLDCVDLVLCTHIAVAETMSLLPPGQGKRNTSSLVLYPEIDASRVASDRRLADRSSGATMTGTLTNEICRAKDLVAKLPDAQKAICTTAYGEGLRQAMAATALFFIPAAAFFWLSSLTYQRDLVAKG